MPPVFPPPLPAPAPAPADAAWLPGAVFPVVPDVPTPVLPEPELPAAVFPVVPELPDVTPGPAGLDPTGPL